MKDEEDVRLFWNRVDELWGAKPLKELAVKSQVDYILFLNWRTKKRFPDLVTACYLAFTLNTRLEYLVLGIEHFENENLREISNALKTASEEDLVLVKRVLRIPDKQKTKLTQKNA